MPSPYTKLDANQVLKHSFDESKDRLRVDATITASISNVSIVDETTGDPAKINADGSIDVNIVSPIEIAISADSDNIAISDGTNTLKVNPDGSLNVIVEPSEISVVNTFEQITSVPSALSSTILSYTPAIKSQIRQVSVSGTNIAQYTIIVNGSPIDRALTYFGGNLNHLFNMGQGVVVNPGQTIEVSVLHERPNLGNFNARLQTVEGVA